MTTTAHHHVSNPFALMMDPETILAAMASSERLARLTSRVCRPLDKPLIARSSNETESETAIDSDEAVDETNE